MAMLACDEVQQLRLFQERVHDLKTSGFVRSGETAVTLHLGITDSERSLDGFDDDYLRSFLQTLRQFVLRQDLVNMNRIHNIIYRCCDHQDLRDWTAYARSLWQDALASTPIEVQANSKTYTVEETLNLFWYSGIVHSERNPVQELSSIPPVMRDALKMMVTMVFKDLCYALVLIDKIIWHWLDAPTEPVPSFNSSQLT